MPVSQGMWKRGYGVAVTARLTPNIFRVFLVEYENFFACARELAGCNQASKPGTYDDDVGSMKSFSPVYCLGAVWLWHPIAV